jgi:hypothetical protein
MKRLVAAVAAVAGCLAATGGIASAAGPSVVSGDGQGVFASAFGPFSSKAHVDAVGDATDAHGHVRAQFFNTPVGYVLIKSDVYCVNAQGNEAIVGSTVVESNTTFVPVGSTVLRRVIDNGQGANDPPDQTGTISFPFHLPSCPSPSEAPIPTGPVDQGNFIVQDGG